jgi:hypothetical protein
MGVLRNFYRTVRPIGFWGPVRASLAASEDLPAPTDSARDLRTCGYGVAFHFLMSLASFSLFAGKWALAAVTLAGMLISGAWFARAALMRQKL